MPGLAIDIAQSEEEIAAVRGLLLAYGALREFDGALGNFAQELAQLPGEYQAPEGYLLLARQEGTPAGCGAFRPLSPEICEMKRLFVLPDFQGLGIGYGLAERLIAEARRAGYRIMRLDSHPWMTAAAKLYAALGFVEIERYNDNPTPGIRFFEKGL